MVTCHSNRRTLTQTQDQLHPCKGLGGCRAGPGAPAPPLKGETTMNQQNAVEGQGSQPARRPHSARRSPESSGSERRLLTASLPEMPWICPDYFPSDRVTLSRCNADSGQSQNSRGLGGPRKPRWWALQVLLAITAPPVPLSACSILVGSSRPATTRGARTRLQKPSPGWTGKGAEAVGREPSASSLSPPEPPSSVHFSPPWDGAATQRCVFTFCKGRVGWCREQYLT